jgi:hypothetical protein
MFHHGTDLSLKTRVSKGLAIVTPGQLVIGNDKQQFIVPVESIICVSMFRLHGLARVIRVDTIDGVIFTSVVRFMIGQFASVNYFRTGALFDELQRLAQQHA